MVTEVSRTARALALSSDDDVTESHLVHVCSEWQELYQKLADLVADNQPSALPDENEMGKLKYKIIILDFTHNDINHTVVKQLPRVT